MTVMRGFKPVSVSCLILGLSLGLGMTPVTARADNAAADIATGAQKEGALTWYAAMLPAEAKALADEFQKQYPKIKVNYVVMRANQIPIRISTEQRAGKYDVDVTSASAWQVAALEPA
ncbi:MAG TPA: hypothetical protein VL574_08355, partial [Stellaceae bacterium]|nr:hypothetical protein [Stellaceae bacterium]